MKRFFLSLLLLLAVAEGCSRNKPGINAGNPYSREAEQLAAQERVQQRGRYDVQHDPNDTMSINSMGSD